MSDSTGRRLPGADDDSRLTEEAPGAGRTGGIAPGMQAGAKAAADLTGAGTPNDPDAALPGSADVSGVRPEVAGETPTVTGGGGSEGREGPGSGSD